ncbi:hypothetical protein Tco_1109742 [Tanacetum coccineum]|uniref:Retrotransposon gag domain-containing protein n=1 Tax=Tanacetum coccineum TaxID=301880 RepID=A0ABQ5IH38_9ASTR
MICTKCLSGTNREDAVENIEYFLKIVDPIDLPNVNQDKLRIVVFPISLVGNAWRWFDEIKGSITSWIDLTAKFFRKYYPPSRTGKINTPIIKWDPTNPEFENWLASKFMNYMTMDIFTKGALWDYWKLGSDEVEPTNEKTFNLEETNQDDEQEIGEIFRIETNLFDYETPLCEKFKEFNYLLKIDPDVLTNDIVGFKTYDEYKDDWIYEWNKNVPWPSDYKYGCSEWPTCSWREDGYCNGGNLPGAYIVENTLRYQDLEWYDALKDSELKEEALRNKAIMEGLINADVESNDEGWKSWDDFEITNGDLNEWEYENEHGDNERYELCGNETHELPLCNIRRFNMIKYSFGQDEEYVAVKENKYEDLTSTSEDACRAYQEIFRMMDEGWKDLAEKKLTMLVKYLQSGNQKVLES